MQLLTNLPQQNKKISYAVIRYWVLSILIVYFVDIDAQDLGGFKDKKPFTWSASVNGGLTYINTSNSYNDNPMAYYVGAQCDISIYGFNLPFSLTYRDRVGNYALPFSRFSFNPSYKWAKLHLGDHAMHFNPYVLSGVQISGAGIELTPGIFRFAVVQGELRNTKAIVDSLNNYSGILNPFKRKVIGVKLGIGREQNFFDLHVLTGADENLIPEFNSDTLTNKLEANTTIGSSWAMSLFKRKLSMKFNGAASGYTHNLKGLSISETDLANSALLRTADSWFDINTTTTVLLAGDASVRLNIRGFTIEGKYQRVDPFYKSFGVFLMRGDNENYTVKSTFGLWKSKIQVSGSYGVNRNNLYQQRNNKTLQSIYNFHVGFIPVAWGGLDVEISNFNFDQRPVIANIQDTFRLIQVNKLNSVNPYFNFKTNDFGHNITLNFSMQSIEDLSSIEVNYGDSYVAAASLMYSLKNNIKKYGLNAQLFYNENFFNNILMKRNGITIGANKNFMNNKINSRLRISYSNNYQVNTKALYQYNASFNSSINFSKDGTFSIQAQFGKRPDFKNESHITDLRIFTQINYKLK